MKPTEPIARKLRSSLLAIAVAAAACGTPPKHPGAMAGGGRVFPDHPEQALFLRSSGVFFDSREIRAHYLTLLGRVARANESWKKAGVPASERAARAHELRQDALATCRSMITDEQLAEALSQRDGPPFAELVAREGKGALTGDAAYEAIAARSPPVESCMDELADAPVVSPPADLAALVGPVLAPEGPGGPGGAVLVTKNGRVAFSGAYGTADLGTKERVTTKTLFNVGSISKTFVASAILILAQRGKLSLDDGVADYFPEFEDKAIGAKVRIRHLLTHTSGLPDNRNVTADPTFYLTAKDAENWAPLTKTRALAFEPGSQFTYSNPAFNALALIVEKVTGAKWQRFVTDEIFRPSGMGTSTITDGAEPSTGVSHAYVKTKGVWAEQDYGEEPTFPAAGNGGVWSSVEELAKYEAAFAGAVFLPREAIADARTPKRFLNWAEPSAAVLGWSWFVTRAPDGVASVGHCGTQGGFRGTFVAVPEKGIHVAFLANSPVDLWNLTGRTMIWLRARRWLD